MRNVPRLAPPAAICRFPFAFAWSVRPERPPRMEVNAPDSLVAGQLQDKADGPRVSFTCRQTRYPLPKRKRIVGRIHRDRIAAAGRGPSSSSMASAESAADTFAAMASMSTAACPAEAVAKCVPPAAGPRPCSTADCSAANTCTKQNTHPASRSPESDHTVELLCFKFSHVTKAFGCAAISCKYPEPFTTTKCLAANMLMRLGVGRPASSMEHTRLRCNRCCVAEEVLGAHLVGFKFCGPACNDGSGGVVVRSALGRLCKVRYPAIVPVRQHHPRCRIHVNSAPLRRMRHCVSSGCTAHC